MLVYRYISSRENLLPCFERNFQILLNTMEIRVFELALKCLQGSMAIDTNKHLSFTKQIKKPFR